MHIQVFASSGKKKVFGSLASDGTVQYRRKNLCKFYSMLIECIFKYLHHQVKKGIWIIGIRRNSTIQEENVIENWPR